MTNVISWDRIRLSFARNGVELAPQVSAAPADAVAQEIKGRLSTIATRLQAGTINLEEAYAESKRLTKLLVMSEKALARGGWDNMRPIDWKNARADVLKVWRGDPDSKFPNGGIRRIFEDASNGFYGQDLRSRGFNAWMERAASQGHSIYENERTEMHRENGFAYGTRLRADVDSCPTCLEEDDKKRPIDEVVPIGESECRQWCRCTIIYDRN